MTNKQFIKKMDEYFDMVSEAFDSPLDIRWVDKDDKLIGLFTVYNNVYQINCNNIGDDFWTYKFFFYDKEKNVMDPNLTGFDKDKFRVLPTVKEGIINLINEKNPMCIIYGSLDESLGRKKLYDSFSKELSQKYDYEYTTQGIGEYGEKQIFILYKNNINKQLLMNKIGDIVSDIENGINY